MVTDESRPLLSFVIPAYNVERYIGRCLDSVLSVSGAEVIVVNDGSTDGTGEIIDDYKSRYDSLKVITQRNAGLSAARNRGMEVASGHFVWFIDSDDYLDPEETARIVTMLDTSCDAYVFGRREVRDQIITEAPSSLPSVFFNSGTEYLKNSIDAGWFRTNAWDKIFSLHVIRDNSISFEEGLLYEDMLFCIQFFTFAGQVRSLRLYPYNYFLGNSESITHVVRRKDLDVLKFVEMAYLFASEHPGVWHSLDSELNQLMFNWTSSCLLNKYVPASFSGREAKEITEIVLADTYFMKSVNYCATHRCRPRYKFFARLILFSPTFYRIVLSTAIKIMK